MLGGKEGHVPNVPRSVLLVDDNADLLDLLSRTLTHVGHFNVLQAENGERGLEQAVAAHPDCIVVDIIMPGLDGYQLVRALRGDPDTAEIPIVVLTALAQDHNRLAGYLVGADRYLVKPVKPQDLIKSIEEAIATRVDERARRLRALAEGEDGDSR